MTLKMQKPEIKEDLDAFIKGAKAEQPVREELAGKPDKTFLLRLPYNLWKQSKHKAGDADISLHDYIIQAIKDKNTN